MDDDIVTNFRAFVQWQSCGTTRSVSPDSRGFAGEPIDCGVGRGMLPLDKDMTARLGLELATKRQEHADLDAAIRMLSGMGSADAMLIQRLKKKKLVLKDRIGQLERILLPDIIA